MLEETIIEKDRDIVMNDKKKAKIVLIVLASIAGAGVIGLFLYKYVAPFGIVVKYQFSSLLDRDRLSKVKGAEESSSFSPSQAGVLQIPQQTIRQNVVTFNLKLITKQIEGVWVNLRFKGNPKEIKIGVRGSEKGNFQYQPLYNQVLNSLTWNQTSVGETNFWQKEKKYKDIFDLASKPPVSDESKVATYFFNLSDIVMKESVSPSQSGLKIEKTLRGTHTLLVKVDKKPLSLTVVKQDQNTYKGEDVLSIQIYNGQNKIAEQLIPDDGVTDAGGLTMAAQKGEIKINDIKPGIYQIVLKDMTESADTRIKSIEVNQSSLVFNNIFILDEKPVTLWTNSKKIYMVTSHTAGIQTVKLDSKHDLKVEKEGKDFVFDLTNPDSKIASSSAGNTPILHKLEISKNDLNIRGDGYFAFSKESFFNPEPIKSVDLSTVSDISTIDYIIANYQKAKKDGEWYTAQAYFDPKDIKVDGDKLYFSLESPELSSYSGEIVIDNLEVTVKKPGWIKAISPTPKIAEENKAPNLWQKIINFFKNIFSKKNNVSKSVSEPSPTSAPTPTPDPKAMIAITVFNSGAGKGAAGKFVAILNQAGFARAEATNAASFDLKNASISYNEKNLNLKKEFIKEIVDLLKKNYDIVVQDGKAKESGLKVILGENPKEVTPTLTKTPEATATPTLKPTP